MKITSQFKLIFTLAITLFVTSINVSAQTVLPVQPVYSSVAAINKIVNGGALYSSSSASGIANEFIRRASGQALPVATSAATGVTAARLAGIAAGAMKAGTVVGLAGIVIPWLWDAAQLKVCPAPDFVCKIDPNSTKLSVIIGGWNHISLAPAIFQTGQLICDAWLTPEKKASGYDGTVLFSIVGNDPGAGQCRFTHNTQGWNTVTIMPLSNGTKTCESGYTLSGNNCVANIPKFVPAVENDITTRLQTQIADQAKAKTVYDELARNKVQVHSGGDTVTITAPAITAPADVTTSSISNADGTTSTKVVSAVSTINPQQVGTTINNTTMSYPVTTVTTTTITNNTTNAQTVTTNNETQKNPEVATPPEPKENDFCKLHPELNICKNSSVSGQCKEISCVGDAIFCAVAKEAAESNCRAVKEKLDMETTAEFKLGRSVLSGVDPLSTSLPTVGRGVAVALPAFDSSGWLGGGSCFPDKTFSIQGKSVTIPFSTVCQYLVIFRYALMIVAMLVSFRILSGAIIRE